MELDFPSPDPPRYLLTTPCSLPLVCTAPEKNRNKPWGTMQKSEVNKRIYRSWIGSRIAFQFASRIGCRIGRRIGSPRTLGNIIFDILKPPAVQNLKYRICLVFLALCHELYLCICEFVFVYLCIHSLKYQF